MDKEKEVYKTALLLVEHFSHCNQRGGLGLHSRIFSYMLHPEEEFVAAGQSQAVIDGANHHLEHVVPCAVLISEVNRLINKGMPKEEIAELLTKHWKIVIISKEEAGHLDGKEGLNLKTKMPEGWQFETGDTFRRLELAKINILPL